MAGDPRFVVGLSINGSSYVDLCTSGPMTQQISCLQELLQVYIPTVTMNILLTLSACTRITVVVLIVCVSVCVCVCVWVCYHASCYTDLDYLILIYIENKVSFKTNLLVMEFYYY